MTTRRTTPMLRTAKYATRIRPDPDWDADEIGRTVPNRDYRILATRLVAGAFWFQIREGWVREQVRGVRTFREGAR